MIAQCNKGAWLNERNDRGYTAFHLAIENNDAKAVNILIKAGVNVNICTEDGLYPIHIASIHGFQSIIEALVEAGADVNQQTDDLFWNTPLHLSSTLQVWNVLINLGALCSILNSAQEPATPSLHW